VKLKFEIEHLQHSHQTHAIGFIERKSRDQSKMIWPEFGSFSCPGCSEKIPLRATKNDLSARLEAPVPFLCPNCKTKVVFKPWKWMFRFSLLGFILLPSALSYLGLDFDYVLLFLIAISIPLVFSLLCNKLVLYED